MENKRLLRKKLKRWGNNLVITFTQEEEEAYNLKEGDFLDVEDMVIVAAKDLVKYRSEK